MEESDLLESDLLRIPDIISRFMKEHQEQLPQTTEALESLKQKCERSIHYLVEKRATFDFQPARLINLRKDKETGKTYQRAFFNMGQMQVILRLLAYLHIQHLRFPTAWNMANTAKPVATSGETREKDRPKKEYMAFLFLSPGVRDTTRVYEGFRDAPESRELGTLWGDFDLMIRMVTPDFETLHEFFVRQTVMKSKGRIVGKLFVATNPNNPTQCWGTDGEECRKLQAQGWSFAVVLTETGDNGLGFLQHLQAENERLKNSEQPRTVWGVSICAGSCDLVTMTAAKDTKALFSYILETYRNPKETEDPKDKKRKSRFDVIQTVTYLLNEYVIKEDEKGS